MSQEKKSTSIQLAMEVLSGFQTDDANFPPFSATLLKLIFRYHELRSNVRYLGCAEAGLTALDVQFEHTQREATAELCGARAPEVLEGLFDKIRGYNQHLILLAAQTPKNTDTEISLHTPDLIAENIRMVGALFPSCLTEALDEDGNSKAAIDFDLLRQALNDEIVEGSQERYELNWPGKRQALLNGGRPIAKTLRPIPEDSVNFETTQNIFIEGDNLDALKLILESYRGKVKMIYIDPPYNTGTDRIYKDNFAENAAEYLVNSEQTNGFGERLNTNPNTNGRFHSDWLSMVYPRLGMAKRLLADDGVIFISIDDHELENLKKICDEIFGEENFINLISVKAKDSSGASGGGEDRRLKKNIEHLLCFSKSQSFKKFNDIYKTELLSKYINERKENGMGFAYTKVLVTEGTEKFFKKIKDGTGGDIEIYTAHNYEIKTVSQIAREEKLEQEDIYNKYFKSIFTTENAQTSIRSRVADATTEFDGLIHIYYVPVSGRNKGRRTKISFEGKTKRLVSYLSGVAEHSSEGIIKKDKVGTLWNDLSWSSVSLEGRVPYPNGKKPFKFIMRMLELCFQKDESGIVLDFFSGSGTTAHAVMQFNAEQGGNRQCISVQIPEKIDAADESAYNFCIEHNFEPTITEISKERIRRAGTIILENNCHPDWNKDIGFRVLKIDSSNYHATKRKLNEITQKNILESIDNIKPDRSDVDLLFEVLMREGMDLSLPVETKTKHERTVYFVDGTALIACFDKAIPKDLIAALIALKPDKIAFRDHSFARDADRVNMTLQFTEFSPSTIIKVI